MGTVIMYHFWIHLFGCSCYRRRCKHGFWAAAATWAWSKKDKMLGLQLCLPKRFLCWRMDMKQKSNSFLTRPRFTELCLLTKLLESFSNVTFPSEYAINSSFYPCCMNESSVSPWLSAASTLGDRFCICVGRRCLYLYCTVFVWVKSGLNTGDKSSPRLLRWGWSAGRSL